jgi:membrane fusion protein, multidrug efflux system
MNSYRWRGRGESTRLYSMDSEQIHSDAVKYPVEPPKNSRPGIVRWLLMVIVVIALAFVGWKLTAGGTKKNTSATKPSGTSVTVSQARKGSIDVYMDSLGTVTPERTVSVFSQISGRVVKVYYREGQMVKEGQSLVDIDSSPYLAQLTQAEGQLERDQALLAQARSNLTRYQEALKRNAIAKQTVDDQEQLVKQYEGTVKSDQGSVEYDKVQLGYCHIKAPISGRLGLRLVDVGNVVSASSSSTLVVITQLNPITVVFNVPQDSLPNVQKELRKGRSLRVDAYDRMQKNVLASGKLLTMDNEIDTTTGTVKFRAEFNNVTDTLFPNQFVNARLWVNTLSDVILVPTASIQYNSQQAYVWVIDSKNVAHVRNIQTGDSNAKETQVTGVNVGEQIATSNIDRLQEGGSVLVSKFGDSMMMGGRGPR